MKRFIYLFLFIITLITGCKKNESEPTNPGIGGTLGGTVNFQAKAVTQNGDYFVRLIPDKNIVLTRVIISSAALNVKDTASGDNATVFDTQTGFKIGPSPIQLAIGQVWVFVVQGKIGSATGQSFSSSVTLTIAAIENETGGGANVTFTVSVVQDQQQQQYFQFVPDKDVLVTQIIAKCQALGVNETIPNNSGQVFNQGNPLWLGPLNGLQSGQVWEFNLTGTIGNANGEAYNENVSYTIP